MIGDHALAPHLDSIDAWPFIIRKIIFENAAHETIINHIFFREQGSYARNAGYMSRASNKRIC